MSSLSVGKADPADAHEAALLAAEKRAEYEQYSPVFWRPAQDALERHEPWLAHCLEAAEYSSLAARRGAQLAGIVIAAHTVAPPPLRSDEAWLVDDFFVQTAEGWADVGSRLLAGVEDLATSAGAQRIVVLTARADQPKKAMLHERGYQRGASWWVLPVKPSEEEPPELQSIVAVTGPAPPVYDPGGLTALAISVGDVTELPTFTQWSAASGAILAIVAAQDDPELERSLEEAHYEVASDWYVKEL